jgi:hypothetical protein
MPTMKEKPLSLLRAAFVAVMISGLLFTAAAQTEAVALRWLDDAPPSVSTGVTWGVPWAEGAVAKEQVFSLTSGNGATLPLQSWPLAYWADGSVKWSGFATVAGPEAAGELKLASVPSASAPENGVRVRESDTTVEIDTGVTRTSIRKWGGPLIDSIVVDGRVVARDGRLICVLQNGPDGAVWDTPSRERFLGTVDTVTVEQSGPVRAVVKLDGKHRGTDSDRSWLPFSVRLYFYAGEPGIRVVHTLVFDGDEQRDFIRGLGLTFAVPMREQIHNRHVRFGGEGDGLWSEPIQPMIGRGGRFVSRPGSDREDVYPDQLAGKRVPNYEEISPRGQGWLRDWAVWGGFKLMQPNADGFTIVKRTNAESAWLPAGAGKRASGFAFVGDVGGGLGVGVKNFWQSYPASLEIQNAGTGSADLTAWLWSPDGPAMDMRHYDTVAHGLQAVYEDVQPGFSTPYGVARTSELMLFPSGGVPTKPESAAMAQVAASPPLIVATPEALHDAGAFGGYWSLPDRSTPFKAAIENQLDSTTAYYLTSIDQHNWYGFWDYGDVMHSYDDDRHVWRYDLGGMAWDNSELGTDVWLWYSFLRSGRADLFRMAEAMTRHTGEVDCYHIGPFAGLGSRHNVRHWGCGAKEARISQAAYRRYYYYLTADERTGDIMREMLISDFAATEWDPMRLAQPITEREKAIAPGRVRLGPDWFAFIGNWMTEWERTLDPKWRAKIDAGIASLDAMPLGLRTGRNLVMGYDPDTGKLYQLSDEAGTYNLSTIMGGAQVIFELSEMLDDERWNRLWLQFCRVYDAPKDIVLRDMDTLSEGLDAEYLCRQQGGPRLAAYLYQKTGNRAFGEAAIRQLAGRRGISSLDLATIDASEAVKVLQEARVGTNGAAQSGLNMIEVLEMCADLLPTELPEPPANNGFPGRR